MTRLLLALSCAVAMAACAPRAVVPPPVDAGPPAAVPVAAADASVYAIDSAGSDVRFVVGRAGRFAHLGHRHVVRARNITGHVALAPDFHRSTLSLSLPVADFEVDPADARADEGADFGEQPPPEAIAGTRRNMLGEKVLDAARYPEVRIDALRVAGPSWAADVTVRITLRGVARELTVPVSIARDETSLVATAVFKLRQSDFGITPLSALGGALQVADAVRVRMRIVARRG